MRKAVIDVGSNSVILVVAEQKGGAWELIREQIAVTALGEGTKATGRLGEAGIAATLEALRRFFSEAWGLGVEEPIAAATMAARIASNTRDFQGLALAQGTPVSVLSGEDEAQLGFQSVASDPLFAAESRISIIDPGGHSTELVTADRSGSDWIVRFRRSYSIGTLGLKSSYFPDERLSPMSILSSVKNIDDQIGLAYLPQQSGAAIVLGATGTNLVLIRDRILSWEPERVNGATLGYEEVSKAFGWLGAMSDLERADVPGLEPGREKTIHLGALILERFLYALRTDHCRVSVRGWRHALLENGLPERH
ncbi:MAG: hypothetical protein H7Y17_11955 [Chlorobia bacterium]|nr:hypothetical protein [Fimbriimonadaceae bacterium]